MVQYLEQNQARIVAKEMVPFGDIVPFLDPRTAREIGFLTTFENQSYKTAQLMNLLWRHHPPTFKHATETATFAAELARLAGETDQTMADISQAALLHDQGKLVVPPEVLSKTDPLTEEEKYLIRLHDVAGAAILSYAGMNPLAVTLCLEHHIGNSRSFDWPAALLARRHPLTPYVSLGDMLSAAMDHDREHKEPLSLVEITDEVNDKIDQGIFPAYLQEPFNTLVARVSY